jgi:hypothetical protein
VAFVAAKDPGVPVESIHSFWFAWYTHHPDDPVLQ